MSREFLCFSGGRFDLFFSCIVVVQFFLLGWYYLLGGLEFYYLAFITPLVAILGIRSVTQEELVGVGIMVLFLVGFLFKIIISGSDDYSSLGVVGVVFSSLVLRRSRLPPIFWSALLVAFSLYMVYQYYFGGVDPNDLLAEQSRNRIVPIIVSFFSLAYLAEAERKKGRKYGYWTLFVCAVSIISLLLLTGRSGLVAAVGLMLVFFFGMFKENGGAGFRWFIMIVVGISIVSGVVLYSDHIGSVEYLIEKGVDSSRYDIWSNLVGSLRGSEVVVGLDPNDAHERAGHSLHNSFLYAWVNYGLVGLFVVVAMFFLMFFLCFKNSIEVFFLVLIFFVLGVTSTFLLTTMAGAVWLLLLYYMMRMATAGSNLCRQERSSEPRFEDSWPGR